MVYTGSCHCGRVIFEVEGELKGAMSFIRGRRAENRPTNGPVHSANF